MGSAPSDIKSSSHLGMIIGLKRQFGQSGNRTFMSASLIEHWSQAPFVVFSGLLTLCLLMANSGHKVNAELSPQMPLSLCPLLTQSGHNENMVLYRMSRDRSTLRTVKEEIAPPGSRFQLGAADCYFCPSCNRR